MSRQGADQEPLNISFPSRLCHAEATQTELGDLTASEKSVSSCSSASKLKIKG